MSVLQLKPHKIQKYEFSTEGHYDELGEWVQGNKSLSSPIECDIVRGSGRASRVSKNDGDKVEYSFTIYIDKNVSMKFSVGESVLLTLMNGEEYQLDVVGFEELQLQKKVYLA